MQRTPHILSIAGRVIVSALLFWALDTHAYGYFTLLRWVTFAISAYLGFLAFRQKLQPWIWMLVFVMILFNPLAPIHFGRETWEIIDCVTALFLLSTIPFIREDKRPSH